jgi:hypothetical protein
VHMVAVAASIQATPPLQRCSCSERSLGLFADGCLAYAYASEGFFVLLGSAE